MKAEHLLVAFVIDDTPDGDSVFEIVARNWSRRRVKVLTRQMARRVGAGGPMVVIVPPRGDVGLMWGGLAWNQASAQIARLRWQDDGTAQLDSAPLRRHARMALRDLQQGDALAYQAAAA